MDEWTVLFDRSLYHTIDIEIFYQSWQRYLRVFTSLKDGCMISDSRVIYLRATRLALVACKFLCTWTWSPSPAVVLETAILRHWPNMLSSFWQFTVHQEIAYVIDIHPTWYTSPVLSLVGVEVQGMRVKNNKFDELSSDTQTNSLIISWQELLYSRCSIIIIHFIVETIVTSGLSKLTISLCLRSTQWKVATDASWWAKRSPATWTPTSDQIRDSKIWCAVSHCPSTCFIALIVKSIPTVARAVRIKRLHVLTTFMRHVSSRDQSTGPWQDLALQPPRPGDIGVCQGIAVAFQNPFNQDIRQNVWR